MIEFRADQRVAFAVGFVASEKFDVRTHRTAIDFQLLFFDRGIFLRGLDLGALGQSARQGGIEIGVTRFVLQSADRFEWLFAGRAGVDSAKIAQVQIRISQIGLGLHQLGLFVGERDLGATGIQRANRPGAHAFALAFQFLAQNADGLLAHMDFLPIQKQFVEREAHIHRDAIGHGLELVLLFGRVQLCDRYLIAGGAAGVKIFHHPDRGVVIVRTKPRRLRLFAPAIKSIGNDRGKITGARFDLGPVRGLNFLPGNRDFGILVLRQPNDVVDRVAGRAPREGDRGQRNEREKREAKDRSHRFFSTSAHSFATKFPRNQMSNSFRATADRENSAATQPLRGYSFNKSCTEVSVGRKGRRPVAEQPAHFASCSR